MQMNTFNLFSNIIFLLHRRWDFEASIKIALEAWWKLDVCLFLLHCSLGRFDAKRLRDEYFDGIGEQFNNCIPISGPLLIFEGGCFVWIPRTPTPLVIYKDSLYCKDMSFYSGKYGNQNRGFAKTRAIVCLGLVKWKCELHCEI